MEKHFGVDPKQLGAAAAPSENRTVAESIAAPTLAEMFSIPYRTGPIAPVTDENQEAGRIRFEPLFRLAYPARGLVKRSFFGHPVTVHEKMAPALARVEKRLAAEPSLKPFLAKLGGSFNDRVIAGTDRTSAHAFGIALDINPALSDYWRWQKGPRRWRNRVPQALVDAFEAEGFIWGGRWYHYDTMHFEYRPELFDPACYAR